MSNKDTKTVGTPFYMAPETIDGHSNPRSDIWSVGVIVYLMLTGKYAFQAEKSENLYKKIKNDDIDMKPLIDSQCSEEAKDFICKCLKKKIRRKNDYCRMFRTSMDNEILPQKKFEFIKQRNR